MPLSSGAVVVVICGALLLKVFIEEQTALLRVLLYLPDTLASDKELIVAVVVVDTIFTRYYSNISVSPRFIYFVVAATIENATPLDRKTLRH